MDVDHDGEMLGFRALRYILQPRSSFHYPLRPAAFAPILPTAEEMPELPDAGVGPAPAPFGNHPLNGVSRIRPARFQAAHKATAAQSGGETMRFINVAT